MSTPSNPYVLIKETSELVKEACAEAEPARSENVVAVGWSGSFLPLVRMVQGFVYENYR